MPSQRYHHGDLRNAVREAALRVLAEQGPAALSLRQVAAEAGVSHTAPRHHFTDKRHLLTELAVEGFERLDAMMAEAEQDVDEPSDAVAALLGAYVRLRRDHPGHAAVMWRTDLLDPDDPRLRETSLATFRRLHAAVRRARPGDSALRLSLLLWSLAHGAADLSPRLTPALAAAVGDPDPDLPSPEVLVEQLARDLLGGHPAR